jgi:hypothetical protein
MLETEGIKSLIMKKNIQYLLLIVLLSISCGKKATVHIKAINVVTGEPYAGLTYGIVATKSGLNGEKKVFEETGILDANGEAYVSVRVKTGRTYSVGTSKPPNMCYDKSIQYTFGKEDLPNLDFKFEYAECANLKLDIENINCQGPTDKMNFQFKNNYSNYNGWSTDRLGCYTYLSPEYFQIPAGWIIYQWKVDRAGTMTNFMDSIFIPAGGQGTFFIDY